LITGGDPGGRPPIPHQSQFKGEDFLPAPEVERIAKAMIAELPEFEHLQEWRIRYAWKREGGKKLGKLTLGTCTKTGGLIRFFGECDFVVAISADNCFALTNWDLEVLIYHELCHAGSKDTEEKDAEGEPIFVPVLLPHDVEEFSSVVRRYGPWKPELRELGTAYDQAPLFDDEPVQMRRRAS
jgi:hypothetical protein